MSSKMILSAAAVALLFSSCRKTDATTSDPRAVFGYQLSANSHNGGDGRSTGDATIQWTDGYAYPREMRFGVKPDGSIYDGDHVTDYRSLDTARIDLFAKAPKVFGHVALDQEIYKEVELRIKLAPRSVYPAVQLKGTYTGNAGTQPVTLQIFDACDLKTEVRDFAIDKKANFDALTSFDLSMITKGITEDMMNNAELSEGVLLISNSVNKNIHDIIVNNMKATRCAVQVSSR